MVRAAIPCRMSEGRKRIVIDSAFVLGDFVKMRVEPSGYTGQVIGITLRPTGVAYCIQWSATASGDHYEVELTSAEEPTPEPHQA